VDTGDVLSDLRLHRTKCTALIKSVLSPWMKNTIKVDMRGKKYSLLVDETTDISVEKICAICARYFSEMESKVVTVFLGLYRTIHTTGAEVFSVIENCIAEYDLVIENMIGFGCDGASSMVGSHNSVFSRIQAANPHTVLMKCVCHSLALCVQHAFEVMPSDVGYILSVISSWFSNSDIRRMEYQSLFEAFEIDDDANEDSTFFGSVCASVAMPFVKFSKTRWLVRGRVIAIILSHWEPLKQYFATVLHHCPVAARKKAKMILSVLSDDANHLFLSF